MVRFATALLIIGGLNWLLIGLFGYNLVGAIFGGSESALSRIVYSLVGLAAIYELFVYPRFKRVETRTTGERRAA